MRERETEKGKVRQGRVRERVENDERNKNEKR
jgi:hypothetical protein